MLLSKKNKYLQIALNGTLNDARRIISWLPPSERILVEIGTPLLKTEGARAISEIKTSWGNKLMSQDLESQMKQPILADVFQAIDQKDTGISQLFPASRPYVIADYKAMDRGETEVSTALLHGASAITVLGQAPVETQDVLIATCEKAGIDSIIDMMNVDHPYKVLRKLKKLPSVVMLHRGVDEEEYGDKPFPIHQITKIKGAFDVMVAIGGGDTIREVQSAIFNGADIVMVWKDFYTFDDSVGELAREFLRVIK